MASAVSVSGNVVHWRFNDVSRSTCLAELSLLRAMRPMFAGGKMTRRRRRILLGIYDAPRKRQRIPYRGCRRIASPRERKLNFVAAEVI